MSTDELRMIEGITSEATLQISTLKDDLIEVVINFKSDVDEKVVSPTIARDGRIYLRCLKMPSRVFRTYGIDSVLSVRVL